MNTAATLSPAETNLRAAADAVRAALADFDKAATDLQSGQTQRDSLTAQIESDTAAVSLDDPAALQLLAGKKQRLELLTNRAANPDVLLSPLVGKVRDALRPVPDSLRAFLSPVREQLLDEISERLKSYEPDTGRRRQLAQESEALRKLHALATCYWAVFEVVERPIETARRVLAEVSEILAGAAPWLE